MPEISRFYGIIIYIYTKDHNPPHIHAKYAGEYSEISIDTGKVIEGNLPPTAKRLVKRWVELHKDELFANWEIAQQSQTPFKITPLK
jgi:hypothetical protein